MYIYIIIHIPIVVSICATVANYHLISSAPKDLNFDPAAWTWLPSFRSTWNRCLQTTSYRPNCTAARPTSTTGCHPIDQVRQFPAEKVIPYLRQKNYLLVNFFLKLQPRLASLRANFQPPLASLHPNFQPRLASLHANFQPRLASLHANFQPHVPNYRKNRLHVYLKNYLIR